jgi:hypothetical protein
MHASNKYTVNRGENRAMKYSIRNEGRIVIAERLVYTAPKGSVPIGFAPVRTENIPVSVKSKGGETDSARLRIATGA